MTSHTWTMVGETWAKDWAGTDKDKPDTSFGDDPHNGPECRACGFHFCVHCHPEGWDDQTCGEDSTSLPNGPAASTLGEAMFGILSRATVGDVLRRKNGVGE